MDQPAKPRYPHPLQQDPIKLAGYHEWSGEVYQDLLDCRQGKMSEARFREKHVQRLAILVLDVTGFTLAAIHAGELHALLRILDVQRVCGPIFDQYGAKLVRAFADDMTAIFEDPKVALEAALEIQHRIEQWNAGPDAVENAPLCCVGLGYGDVFAIGPNRAMGDEMNRASKLGEDIADGGEILITEGVFEQVSQRADCEFHHRGRDNVDFSYYSVLWHNQ